MNNEQIIRAWKDVNYRNSLSPEQLAALPQHPSGLIELNDADLQNVAGGGGFLSLSYSCSSRKICGTDNSIRTGGDNYPCGGVIYY